MSPLSLRGQGAGFVLRSNLRIYQSPAAISGDWCRSSLKAKPRTPQCLGLADAGFGLAALMYRRPIFDLPPVFATIAENVARVETMQARAGAVRAVAEAVERSEH